MEPEIDGTGEATETSGVAPEVEAPSPGPSEAGETPAVQDGFNPAWTGLRDAIGEDHFDTFARPLLSEMDRNAQNRITALNTQLKGYEGYKPFTEAQIDPTRIENALAIADSLENEPERLYAFLKERFGEEVAADVTGVDDPTDVDQSEVQLPAAVQAQLTAFHEFQENAIRAAEQQEQEERFNQTVEQETARIDQEYVTFFERNPSYTDADKDELLQIQYELTRDLGERGLTRVATVDEAAGVLRDRREAYRQRFGGAQAPSTLPTSAGGSVAPAKRSVSDLSKDEFNALVAADLEAARRSN